MILYLDDVASDLSVFHRIDDWRGMPAPLFFSYARRLPAYQGVMRVRAMELDSGNSYGKSAVDVPRLTPKQMREQGQTPEPGTRADGELTAGFADAARNPALMQRTDPRFPAVIEYSRG